MSKPVQRRAIAVLRETVEVQTRWIKVHAAEFLIWTNNGDRVRETFLEEERLSGNDSPYRIGIWRVLAQASSTKTERDLWISKILQAFLDPDGQDRVHAAENPGEVESVSVEGMPENDLRRVAERRR